MRLAFAANENNGLDSLVSAHFGRCPYFVLVDVEGNEVKAVRGVQNPYFNHHAPGQVPAFIHTQGADVMLSGGMGRRAVDFFNQFGIEAVSGAAGTVRQALEAYLSGTLRGYAPCAESEAHHHHGHHHGMA